MDKRTRQKLLRTTPIWLGSALLSVALLVLAAWLSEDIPVERPLALTVAFVVVAATILATATTAPVMALRSLTWLWVPVAASLAGVLLAREVASDMLGAGVLTVAILLGGTMFGAAVGARIEHPGHLLVVAMASSIADIFTVLSPVGSAAAVLRTPRVLGLVALQWPELGTDDFVPVLGLGDVVFAAIYLAASRKHRLGLRETVRALAEAFLVALLVVFAFGFPMPASSLPYMGAAVLIAHPEARRLAKRDRVRAYIGMTVLALLVIALWFLG